LRSTKIQALRRYLEEDMKRDEAYPFLLGYFVGLCTRERIVIDSDIRKLIEEKIYSDKDESKEN
jgi:hypothetical protein